ncbi:MAG: hypothetical protein ACLVHQ_03185 [Oscillospiraceae bacterium]
MDVYTLVGKSGTGKSFHAMNLCKKLGVEAIIDDGLFIYKNSVIAGVSAKRQDTKIGAVKTALFLNDEMQRQVSEAIKREKPASILVLGTSEEMVDKIIERLGLPAVPPESPRRIRIEEITTEDERIAAHRQRNEYGKHVIPASSLQLKRTFAGYFMDPLRFFRGKDQGASSERTVVRPAYSYLGEYFVAERVIDDIIMCLAHKTPSIGRVINVIQKPKPDTYRLKVAIKIRSGYPVWPSAMDFQKSVEEAIEKMTAFNVTEIEIEIRGIN